MTAYTKQRPVNGVEGIHFVENFLLNDSVADAAVGLGDWELDTIGNASTLAGITGADGFRPGGLKITTANTADGDGESLSLKDDAITIPTSTGGGGFAFLAQLTTTLAGNNFRIGLTDVRTAGTPNDGICVLSDAGVITLETYSDTQSDKTKAVASNQVSTLTSGTTMVVDTWHLFEVQWSGDNGNGGPDFVELFIDGEPAASVHTTIATTDTVELSIVHWQDTGGAAARIMQIAFYEYWQFFDLPLAAAL